jgi:hypothetical protein
MKTKITALFAALLCIMVTACQNPETGEAAAATAAPEAYRNTIAITSGQRSVNVPMVSNVNGEWKIYRKSDSAEEKNISAFFAPSTKLLKLSGAVSLEPTADYLVTVTERGKPESAPMELRLRYPSALPALADPLDALAELTSAAQGSIGFTLAGDIPVGQWAVYAASEGGAPCADVTVQVASTSLTLENKTQGSALPPGIYYVALTETDKAESARLALTVYGYDTTRTPRVQVSSAAGYRLSKPATAVSWTLSNPSDYVDGTTTWQVYDAPLEGNLVSGITASKSGNTLTLSGTDIPAGSYFVSAQNTAKTPSNRAGLLVTIPESITFTVGAASVDGLADGGAPVSATVNGSPTYSQVNGLNVLTFNTTVDGNFTNGDSVALNPIAGDYIPGENWTLELIVHSPTNGQLVNFFGPNGRDQAGCFWIEHSTGGGYWLFRVYNGSGAANRGVGVSRPSPSVWSHVAYVRTGSTVTCYVNGTQGTSANAGNPNTTIGEYLDNPAFAAINSCLVGMRSGNQLHLFRISKQAITPANDASHYSDAQQIVTTLNGG